MSKVSALVLALVASVLVAAGAPVVAQQTIVVDSTSNVVDFGGAQQVGDLPGPDGKVTLREAIIAANNTPGPNTIEFRIPTSDPGFNGNVFLLFIEGIPGLVLWDDATTIDGTTQLDFTGHRVHVRTTPQYGNLRGLTINSDGNRVTGMSGFSLFRYGIEINGDDNEVTNNLLAGGLSAGIYITGSYNTIGGTSQDAGNVIRSHGNGIWIRPAWDATPPSATGNVVQGNLITSNHNDGISIDDGTSGNLVGGTTAAARNVINSNGHLSGEYARSGPTSRSVAAATSCMATPSASTHPEPRRAADRSPVVSPSPAAATRSAGPSRVRATSSPATASSPRSSTPSPPGFGSSPGPTRSSRAT